MSVVKNKQLSDGSSYPETILSLENDFKVSNYLQNSPMIIELYIKCKTAYVCLIRHEKMLAKKVRVEAELKSVCKEKTIELREASKVIERLEQENEYLKKSLK